MKSAYTHYRRGENLSIAWVFYRPIQLLLHLLSTLRKFSGNKNVRESLIEINASPSFCRRPAIGEINAGGGLAFYDNVEPS